MVVIESLTMNLAVTFLLLGGAGLFLFRKRLLQLARDRGYIQIPERDGFHQEGVTV